MKDFPYATPATGWFQVAWEHELSPGEQRVIDEQFRQVAMDFPIWENMRYIVKAPIVREESPTYQNFRKWSRQFYLPTEGPLQNA